MWDIFHYKWLQLLLIWQKAWQQGTLNSNLITSVFPIKSAFFGYIRVLDKTTYNVVDSYIHRHRHNHIHTHIHYTNLWIVHIVDESLRTLLNAFECYISKSSCHIPHWWFNSTARPPSRARPGLSCRSLAEKMAGKRIQWNWSKFDPMEFIATQLGIYPRNRSKKPWPKTP